MTDYETTWVPKIEQYRAELDKQVEPYKHFIEGVDTSDERFNAVEALDKLLTPRELEVTNYSAKQLIAKQKAGELTALEIFESFAKRGAIAHLFTNCAMQFFFEEGRERAKELDKYREEHNGELVGAFHGLPISLKELMKYGGKVTNAGYVCYLDNVIPDTPRDESVSIQILRKMGAVFYIRDTQPQCVMHLDTQSVIHGRTTNPYNAKLSPGGSSGGDSAAIALGAAVFGVGSDIGGSIRAPAAFTGLYGIRATTKRFSGLGSLSGGAGQESIFSSQGPLTKKLEDLEYYTEHYINTGKPWLYDPNAVPLEWRKVDLPEEVTFGFVLTDTLVDPSDAILRALEFVKTKLEGFQDKKINVKIVKLDHDLMAEAYQQTKFIYGQSKPTHDKLLAASGEPILPLTQVFLNFANKEENDILDNNIRKENVKVAFHHLFEDEGIDFLVSPTYANVADIPKNITHWNYTSLFNLIDFPNIVFKTGLTYDPKVDLKGPSNAASDWNPEDYINAPLNLQLTAKRFEDEKLLEGVKLLDKVLGL